MPVFIYQKAIYCLAPLFSLIVSAIWSLQVSCIKSNERKINKKIKAMRVNNKRSFSLASFTWLSITFMTRVKTIGHKAPK